MLTILIFKGNSHFGRGILDFFSSFVKQLDDKVLIPVKSTSIYFGDNRATAESSNIEIIKLLNPKIAKEFHRLFMLYN